MTQRTGWTYSTIAGPKAICLQKLHVSFNKTPNEDETKKTESEIGFVRCDRGYVLQCATLKTDIGYIWLFFFSLSSFPPYMSSSLSVVSVQFKCYHLIATTIYRVRVIIIIMVELFFMFNVQCSMYTHDKVISIERSIDFGQRFWVHHQNNYKKNSKRSEKKTRDKRKRNKLWLAKGHT